MEQIAYDDDGEAADSPPVPLSASAKLPLAEASARLARDLQEEEEERSAVARSALLHREARRADSGTSTPAPMAAAAAPAADVGAAAASAPDFALLLAAIAGQQAAIADAVTRLVAREETRRCRELQPPLPQPPARAPRPSMAQRLAARVSLGAPAQSHDTQLVLSVPLMAPTLLILALALAMWLVATAGVCELSVSGGSALDCVHADRVAPAGAPVQPVAGQPALPLVSVPPGAHLHHLVRHRRADARGGVDPRRCDAPREHHDRRVHHADAGVARRSVRA